MLTEPQCEPRVLGVSRNVVCDTSRLLFATGVNIHVVDDLTRRFIKTRMESKLENPADRRFERPNLIDEIRHQRVQILSDIFTITACYLRSGASVQSADLVGFDQFVRWVAKPLVWLGLPDIIQSSRVAKSSNPDDVLLGQVLPLWKELQNPRGMTVRDVLHDGKWSGLLKHSVDELRRLFGDATNAREDKGVPELSARKIARWIGRMEGRVRGLWRFRRDPQETEQGVLWKAAGLDDNDVDDADAGTDSDTATGQTVGGVAAGNPGSTGSNGELSSPLREELKKCSSRTRYKTSPFGPSGPAAPHPRGKGGRRK
jgi:hypothetical protein